MVITKVGTRKLGKTLFLDEGMLTESVIGSRYEIQIKTKGVPSPNRTLQVLKDGLEEKFNAEVTYCEIVGDEISIQIVGSPFVWSTVLLFIPQILATIGVAVAGIVVYLMVSGVPSWVYGIGAFVALLIFVLPKAFASIFKKEGE